MSTIQKPRVEFDNDVETSRDDPDIDYAGWYCVRTAPFPCPAAGCDFVAVFMTAAHLIVVYPDIDDPKLLAMAHNAKLVGRDPKIVAYEQEYGPAIAYEEWKRIGQPCHGRLPDPAGWDAHAKESL